MSRGKFLSVSQFIDKLYIVYILIQIQATDLGYQDKAENNWVIKHTVISQADTHTDKQTQVDRQTGRETGRQTNRQADKQAGRQTGRQTEK